MANDISVVFVLDGLCQVQSSSPCVTLTGHSSTSQNRSDSHLEKSSWTGAPLIVMFKNPYRFMLKYLISDMQNRHFTNVY